MHFSWSHLSKRTGGSWPYHSSGPRSCREEKPISDREVVLISVEQVEAKSEPKVVEVTEVIEAPKLFQSGAA